MYETEYAYGVARVRAVELSLLTGSDFDQLIAAKDYHSALRLLTDKGRKEGSGTLDICETDMMNVWDFISESVPDKSLLEALIVSNDFANLKAAIKAHFSQHEISDYFTQPCLCDTATLEEAIKTADFELLPDFLRECAENAYKAITEKQSGQEAEFIIDKQANITCKEFAVKSQSKLLIDICKLTSAVCDIKTVRRCVLTGKSEKTARNAVCDCSGIDIDKLIEAAFSGEKLSRIVADAGFERLSEEADGEFTSLEMLSDNLITEMAKEYKHEIFGPSPIVAYYFAKLTENKNVRIILSAKLSGVPAEIIKERVRDIYA